YLTEEVWSWAYSADPDMHDSVHRSPWPSLEEFATIAAPTQAATYDTAIAVVEAVRKAKAEANLSMKAPVKRVMVTAPAATLDALRPAIDDIVRMLHIDSLDIAEGDAGTAPVAVETEFASAEA